MKIVNWRGKRKEEEGEERGKKGEVIEWIFIDGREKE